MIVSGLDFIQRNQYSATVHEKVYDNIFHSVSKTVFLFWLICNMLAQCDISLSATSLLYIAPWKSKEILYELLSALDSESKTKKLPTCEDFFVKREQEVYVILLQRCHISRVAFICWMCVSKQCKPSWVIRRKSRPF